jgi:hypothetical protein
MKFRSAIETVNNPTNEEIWELQDSLGILESDYQLRLSCNRLLGRRRSGFADDPYDDGERILTALLARRQEIDCNTAR